MQSSLLHFRPVRWLNGAALLVLLLVLLATCPSPGAAAVRYVNVASLTPASPYTTWATAATTIQDAVDAAEAGDEIVVTNGTYQSGGGTVVAGAMTRVAVTQSLTVRSVNGPGVTLISGGGTVRCMHLTNGAVLTGFTLVNGFASVGGGGGRKYQVMLPITGPNGHTADVLTVWQFDRQADSTLADAPRLVTIYIPERKPNT